MSNAEEILTKLYGDTEFKDFESAEEFVNQYCTKIEEKSCTYTGFCFR